MIWTWSNKFITENQGRINKQIKGKGAYKVDIHIIDQDYEWSPYSLSLSPFETGKIRLVAVSRVSPSRTLLTNALWLAFFLARFTAAAHPFIINLACKFYAKLIRTIESNRIESNQTVISLSVTFAR